MEESSRFAVGIDIGTRNIHAVLGSVGRDGKITAVGYAETPSAGMRRGTVVDMNAVASAVDECLYEVEKMSGKQVEHGSVSINGTNIVSTKTDGMVTIMPNQSVDEDCINRLQDVAAAGKLPNNRQVLDLHPYEYIIDGQRGIRDPFEMSGSRIEIRANVVSTIKPEYENLGKALNGKNAFDCASVVPSVIAAAEAVLSSQQMENGIGVVDLGDSTTSVAIYDAGELQFVGVVPIGSNDITKDLAMILKTVPEVAEEVKLRFASANFEKIDKDFTIKRDRMEYTFNRMTVDEVVEARLEEIFDGVCSLLKKAGYAKRLPEGVMLTGGGANMRGIDAYARERVELAVRIGRPGMTLATEVKEISKPEFATAIGLMMIDANAGQGDIRMSPVKKKKSGGGGLLKWLKMFK